MALTSLQGNSLAHLIALKRKSVRKMGLISITVPAFAKKKKGHLKFGFLQ
jgi:hypothetical protein